MWSIFFTCCVSGDCYGGLSFFFFNDTATTEIYTLSLHDALPISRISTVPPGWTPTRAMCMPRSRDRKSTRLNSSHVEISYAVFCLKKKKTQPSPVVHLPSRLRLLGEGAAPTRATVPGEFFF